MTPKNAKALLPIITTYAEGKTIQFKTVAGEWADLDMNHLWASATRELRVKPEPKQVLMTADDLPPIFWIRSSALSDKTPWLVTSIKADGQLWSSDDYGISPDQFPNFEWSTDRKTWHSFMKEVIE